MVALAQLSGCSLCKEDVLEKVASPDGKWVATIMTRDCGATTSEYIAVNLQDAKQRHIDGKNDVFVIKHIHPLRVSDRKSTRLNSSHRTISYAVFCLKKKKELQ